MVGIAMLRDASDHLRTPPPLGVSEGPKTQDPDKTCDQLIARYWTRHHLLGNSVLDTQPLI